MATNTNNKTPNLELSQYSGTDNVNFLNNYNSDMLNIDNAVMQEASDRAQAVADEATARGQALSQLNSDITQAITDAVTQEASDRQGQIDELNGELKSTNEALAGARTVSMPSGQLLGTDIGIMTPLYVDELDPDVVLTLGKSIFHDEDGTLAVYTGGLMNDPSGRQRIALTLCQPADEWE